MSLTRTDVSQDKVKNYDFFQTRNQHSISFNNITHLRLHRTLGPIGNHKTKVHYPQQQQCLLNERLLQHTCCIVRQSLIQNYTSSGYIFGFGKLKNDNMCGKKLFFTKSRTVPAFLEVFGFSFIIRKRRQN